MKKVIVIGIGEIGKPLLELLSEKYSVEGVDITPKEIQEDVEVMHICYPYQIEDFIGTTVEYIKKYNPELTIINSTVIPGTTRKIYERVKTPVVYSPVRGKHHRMKQDLLYYTKYIAGIKKEWCEMAAEHFAKTGIKTEVFSSPEALELAKLISTTYFGLLIAWAQEVERFCKKLGVDYEEVMGFTKEIPYFPPVIFVPGYIGGHCIIPNIYLLKEVKESPFLEVILKSNEKKKEELIKQGKSLDERVSPKKIK